MSIDFHISAIDATDFLNQIRMMASVLIAEQSAPDAPVDPVMPEVRRAQADPTPSTTLPEKTKRHRRTAAEIAADAAKDATSGAVTQDYASDADDEAELPQETAAEEAQPASAGSSEPLNYDADVVPVVLACVRSKGRPFVLEVLSQFGVARASDLPAERWGELIAALTDA